MDPEILGEIRRAGVVEAPADEDHLGYPGLPLSVWNEAFGRDTFSGESFTPWRIPGSGDERSPATD